MIVALLGDYNNINWNKDKIFTELSIKYYKNGFHS